MASGLSARRPFRTHSKLKHVAAEQNYYHTPAGRAIAASQFSSRGCAFHSRASPLQYALVPHSRRRAGIADVVGLGINATDTVIQLPRFPEFNSKLEVSSASVLPGGQVATALIACSKWGLSTRYIGSIGDDAAGELQEKSLHSAGVETHLMQAKNCLSQFSFILVDGQSGERTILWKRDPRLTLKAEHLKKNWILNSRVLLVDGHDTAAAAQAAKWAHSAQIPVVADVDNVYPGLEALLEQTDYLLASPEFPARLGNDSNPLVALPQIAQRYGCNVTGITLGRLGALAWDGSRFHYSRGFVVSARDTTGAGDVFHAGIVYGILGRWKLREILEFSCATAALNCTAFGARGGIKSLREIRKFIKHSKRSESAFSPGELMRSSQQQKEA